MLLVYLCLSLGLVSIITFIVLRLRKARVSALFMKVLAGMFYILLSLVVTYEAGFPVLGLFIVAGQIFGLLGDIFLDQKYIHSEYQMTYTHFGFTMFGFGHLFFAMGLMVSYKVEIGQLLIATFIASLICGFVYFTEKPFKLSYEKMKVDVVSYSFVLGFMTALPLVLSVANGFNQMTINIILFGMISFLISDLVLSQVYFGKDNDKPIFIIINYIFYYLAQYVIALSILFF